VGDDDYVPPVDASPVSAPEGRQGRTKIDDAADFGPGKVGFRPAEEGVPSVKRDRPRRVAGWMISFDFNDAGQEYVLREGRNTVGRNKDCDVSLLFDEHVSGTHAVIVYHADGECAIQDQMSSGGTFVNGQKIGIGGVSPLRSGDLLKVGRSVFKVFLLEKQDLMILLPSMRERASQP
jgi:hypothetical protein